MAERHLAQAEEAVALGRKHIARQRLILDELGQDGHDTLAAEALLKTLLETQVLHEEHRDRLRHELGLT